MLIKLPFSVRKRHMVLLLLAAVLLLGPAIASASAGSGTPGGGVGADFGNELVDLLFGWMRGWLGKLLAGVALIFAGVSAVTRGFTIGVLTLLGVCILCAFGPDMVDNFFSATLIR